MSGDESKAGVHAPGADLPGEAAYVGPPPVPPDLEMPRTFGDAVDYVIVRELARGGMGTVYEARACGVRGFSKRVALKVILPELSGQQDLRELFVAEAHLVANLVHDNIVQIYHLGEIRNRLYFSMELIEGVPVAKLLERCRQRHKRLPVELAAFIASRVCRALEYAHTVGDVDGRPLGIVHRDICPQNVLVTTLGVVKLSDFGVAKAAFARLLDDLEGKVLVGKARYMSPEQARFEETDARSDIFSLGVVLHEMLSGGDLFPGTTTGRTLENVRVRTILPIRMLNPAVPERLEGILARALERDREERYQSAGVMGLDLERFLYDKGYGPTNLTLAAKVRELFPELYTVPCAHGEETEIDLDAIER